MPNELRLCIYKTYGGYRRGLFHCWAVSASDNSHYIKRGETAALVENDDGIILEIKPQHIRFIDTDKYIIQFDEYRRRNSNANATEEPRTESQS